MRVPLEGVSPDKVVGIHYSLRDDHGQLLETSARRGALFYMPGTPRLARGIDRAILGHQPGDFIHGELDPSEGYGTPHTGSERAIARSRFPGDADVHAGDRILLEGEGGEKRSAWIKEITPDSVIVDLNHPYAGRRLRYEVFVMDVRDATPEERETGRVYRPG